MAKNENIQTFSAAPVDLQQQWIHILPSGLFMAIDGRGPFDLSDPAAVIAASKRKTVELNIDRDHETEYKAPGEHKTAAGWIKEMEARADGIWARVEWTPTARQQIENKEYRYISPVFSHAPDGTVLRIRRASLTNDPALELTAVASAQNKNKTTQEPQMDKHLLAIATALGLTDPKDGDAVVAAFSTFAEKYKSFEEAITALRERMGLDEKGDLLATASALVAGSKPDPAQYVPMAAHSEVVQQLANLQKETRTAKAEEAVMSAMKAGKVSPALKDWALELASSNMDKFNEYVKNAPSIIMAGEEKNEKITAAGAELSAEELTVCQQLGVSPEAYKKKRDEKQTA